MLLPLLSTPQGSQQVSAPLVYTALQLTNSWVQRVVDNGGSVSPATQAAVSAFIATNLANGIWPRLKRLNLFCGTGLAAAMVPLIGANLDIGVNIVAGDYTESIGLKGDATTKYVNTGIYAFRFPGGVTCDARGPLEVVGGLWGVQDASGFNNEYSFRRANSAAGFACWGGPTASVCNNGWVTTASLGFWHHTRKLQNSQKTFKNGVVSATNGINATIPVLSPLPFYVLAINYNGVAGSFSGPNNYCSGYAIDDGTMPEADEPAWDAAWAAFRLAMGRP